MAGVSDEAVEKATGQARAGWYARLDAWGAAARSHREIAAWLEAEHGVDAWWAQQVTVDYEQARGLRAPGGHRDGTFSVGATKTIAAPVARVYAAFADAKERARWLPGADLRERTAQPGRSLRYDDGDGPARVLVNFVDKGPVKAQVAVQHERLSDAAAAEASKGYWRERLGALKELLEGGG